MKRLAHLVLWLYPPAWRRRYREELESLIEESGAGWSAIFDLLKESIRMQLTTWPFGKLAGVLGFAGLIVAVVTSAFVPPIYVSQAELEITPAHGQTDESVTQQIMQIEGELLSRTRLAVIIQDPRLDLYPSERESMPLEDVIEKMRTQNIRIAYDAPSHLAIQFSYPDKQKAQAVVHYLAAKFREESLMQARLGVYSGEPILAVLDPPSFPVAPRLPWLPPDWQDFVPLPIWFKGWWLGLALSAVLAGSANRFLKRSPFGRKTLILGITGLALAALIFPFIPSSYTSQAELQLVGAPANVDAARIQGLRKEALSRSNLSSIIEEPRLDLYQDERKSMPLDTVIEKMRSRDIRIAALSARTPYLFTISFRYPDRLKAQQTVQALITKFQDANPANRRYREGLLPKIRIEAMRLDVRDPPSLPTRPAKPNRYFYALIGLVSGIMSAAFAKLIQKRTVTAA